MKMEKKNLRRKKLGIKVGKYGVGKHTEGISLLYATLKGGSSYLHHQQPVVGISIWK